MHICSLCCQSSLTEIASDTSGSSDCSEDEAKIENSESIAPSAVGSRGPSRHRSPQAPGRHVAAPAVHHDLSSTWTSRTQRQPGGRGNEKAQDARSARPSTSSVPPAILPAGRPVRLSASTTVRSSRTSTSAQRPQRPSVVSSRTMKLHSIRIRQISPPVMAHAGESSRRPSVVSSRRPSTVSNTSVTRVCHGSLEASTRTTVLGSSLVCSTASGRSMSPVWIARGMTEAKRHSTVPQSRTTSPLLGSSLRCAASEVKRAPLAPFNWQVSKPGKDVTSLATRTVSTRSATSSAPSSSSTPIVPLSGMSLPMTNEQASDVAEAVGGITAGRKNVRFCPEDASDPKADLEEEKVGGAGEKRLATGRTPSYGGA